MEDDTPDRLEERFPELKEGEVSQSVRLVIVHRHQPHGAIFCTVGEEILACWIAYRERHVQLKIGLALRLVIDCLCRHRWVSLSALQIESSLRQDEFYRRHAANVRMSRRQTRHIARSSVRTYVARLHRALASALYELEAPFDASEILTIQSTVSNEVTYQIRVPVRIIHCQYLGQTRNHHGRGDELS